MALGTPGRGAGGFARIRIFKIKLADVGVRVSLIVAPFRPSVLPP